MKKKYKNLKKYKNFEIIYKNGKNNHKIRRYWNPKTKVSPTPKTYFDEKIIDINKIVVSNKVFFW